jgi:hypothetical protein
MKWSKTIATVVNVIVGAVPVWVDSPRPPKGISEPQENLHTLEYFHNFPAGKEDFI